MEPIFQYGQQEIRHLQKNDKVLGEVIARLGYLQREITLDPFQALVSSIVSQQISKKAATTVWQRLQQRLSDISAINIQKTELAIIQECGLSFRKAGYIKNLAENVVSGQLDFRKLTTMEDQKIIAGLTQLSGIGVWTAEMFLIFSLARPDVVSYRDLGIRRGMQNIYQLDELSKEFFDEKRKKYSPYGTVASLYLWACS